VGQTIVVCGLPGDFVAWLRPRCNVE